MATFENNGKLKLVIIVETRPEVIRLPLVVDKYLKCFDVILGHTDNLSKINCNNVCK